VTLVVALAGLIVLSLGSTPWVLAVWVITWLAAAAVTLAGSDGDQGTPVDVREGFRFNV